MTNPIKLVAVLTIICVISALALSYVYNDIASPAIAAREKAEAVKMLGDRVPSADDFEVIQDKQGNVAHYEVIIDQKVAMVAIPSEATGFGGEVKVIVVANMEGIITTVSVVSHSETPGYGDRILTEPWFMEQFEGMDLLESEFKIGTDVDALAGATTTSSASAKAVANATSYFKDNFINNKKAARANNIETNISQLIADKNYYLITTKGAEI